jgi:hypothetical protein
MISDYLATIVAAGAAWISYAVYRSQADPDIVVYAESDERRPTLINLIILNAGKAAAYNVKFSSDLKIPSEAYGLDATSVCEHKQMTSGPLIDGIPFLPPNGKRTITWGQYGGLYAAMGERYLLVTARYKSKHFGIPWKIMHHQASILEIKSFKGTDASRRYYDKDIVEQLKAVAEAIRSMTTNSQSG